MSEPAKAVFLSYASPSFAPAAEGQPEDESGGIR